MDTQPGILSSRDTEEGLSVIGRRFSVKKGFVTIHAILEYSRGRSIVTEKPLNR